MKLFYILIAIVITLYLIYIGYVFPSLNSAKSAELWGDENKWLWYAKFCFAYLLYSLIPIVAGGIVIHLWQRYVSR